MAMKVAAALVPKHYTVNVTASASTMLDLIVTLRTLAASHEVSEDVAGFLAALEAAYEGDLPEPPNAPITEDAPVPS